MKCGHRDLEWRLYPMVRYVVHMYGPFHHDLRDFSCSLCLLCAHYDDVLYMPTQNVLAYHMRWSQSFGSCCFLWACLALGLRLGIRICYNLNWTRKILMLGPQKMMRRPPSLPMMYYFLGPPLSDSFIPCLSGDCESSRWCLKSWGTSWGLGSVSETCRMIHPHLDKSLKIRINS